MLTRELKQDDISYWSLLMLVFFDVQVLESDVDYPTTVAEL